MTTPNDQNTFSSILSSLDAFIDSIDASQSEKDEVQAKVEAMSDIELLEAISDGLQYGRSVDD